MRLLRLLAVVLLLAAACPGQQPAVACTLKVRYLANEGVQLESGGKKALVDALFHSAMEPYENYSKETREALEETEGPFAGASVVLATHLHADHFDPDAVRRYLRNNPSAVFMGTEEAVEQVEAGYADYSKQVQPVRESGPFELERGGIQVQALPLLHSGRPKWANPQHLGYLVTLGGARVLHAGDAEGTVENFRRHCPTCEGVDVALVPYWYLLSDKWTPVVRDYLKPKHLVLIHVPPEEAAGLRATIAGEFPQAQVLTRENDELCF